MSLEKILTEKINKYKNLLGSLMEDEKYSTLIEDKFNCGRAMEVQNIITEFEELLSIIEENKES